MEKQQVALVGGLGVGVGRIFGVIYGKVEKPVLSELKLIFLR